MSDLSLYWVHSKKKWEKNQGQQKKYPSNVSKVARKCENFVGGTLQQNFCKKTFIKKSNDNTITKYVVLFETTQQSRPSPK